MAHDNREFDFVAGLRLLDRPTAGEPGGGEREREREKRKKEKERKKDKGVDAYRAQPAEWTG